MRILAAFVFSLVTLTGTLLASTSTAAPTPTQAQTRLARAVWVSLCVHERTGPTQGIAADEALAICLDEVPTDAAELAADPDLQDAIARQFTAL